MKKAIITEIEINAEPSRVWKVLAGFENYGEWNPFIKYLKGDMIIGKKIEVKITPPESSAMTFKPILLAFEANKELRWIGALIFRGLFDGEHKFELINNNNGTTTFRQSEYFSGILVPLFAKKLDNNTKRGFEAMNRKLKEKVEEL